MALGTGVRQVGSGNVGAANVMRQVGIVAGLTVLFLDMAKGLLAVAIARWLGVPLITRRAEFHGFTRG